MALCVCVVQELVAYYQHNSLGSSFPGVDTTLRYPYRDMLDVGATRPRSVSTTPAPPRPSPRNVGGTGSPTGNSLVEKLADVMFAFVADYPDELTIDVCLIVLEFTSIYFSFLFSVFLYRKMIAYG